jgi:hypothetical protein
MLYANVERVNWPLKWEELDYLANQLKNLDWSYDVQVERLILGAHERYRFVLVRWGPRKHANDSPKREELGTYKAVEEIIPILKLLISTEEDKLKEVRVQ